MELSVLDNILSITASVSTIIVLVIAYVTLMDLKSKNKKELENETEKAFYDGISWTNEGNSVEPEVNFRLSIGKAPIHRFSGEIKYNKSNAILDTVFFYFEETNKRVITLDIRKMSGRSEYGSGIEPEYSLGKAILEYKSPDLFKITFHNDCMPDLPSKTHLSPNVLRCDYTNAQSLERFSLMK